MADKQQAEDAAPGVAPAPALLDLRPHQRVEPTARGDGSRQRRAGQRQQLQEHGLAVDGQRRLERLGQRFLPAVGGLETEQAAQRDSHRELAHPVVDLDHLPVLTGARPR